jgi:hypothetical protein
MIFFRKVHNIVDDVGCAIMPDHLVIIGDVFGGISSLLIGGLILLFISALTIIKLKNNKSKITTARKPGDLSLVAA